MGLNYSQKRLIGKALHAKGHSKRTERLRLFAFLTGFMGFLITVVHFVLVIKGVAL